MSAGVGDVIAHAIEETEGTHGISVGGVFGVFEGDLHVRLRAEIVDFVWEGGLDDTAQSGGIGEVCVVKHQSPAAFVRIFVDVVDARGVESRTSADDAVNDVAFGEQEFAEIGAVLAGDSGD